MFETLRELVRVFQRALNFDLPARRGGTVIPLVLEARRSRSRRVLIEGSSQPYWKERGWSQNGRDYEGRYKTRFASCEGKINISPAGYCKIYVKSPPKAVRNHPKWMCFHHSRAGWYRVETVNECCDVSGAILEVENIISESYEFR